MNSSPQNNSAALTQRGLERRLKRHLFKSECTFLATISPGFEGALESEIKQLGGAEIKETIEGGVLFSGPLDLVYSANLKLRTANRILLRIDTFTARSYPELFNKSRKISWEIFCGFSSSVSFAVSSKSSRLHHTENIETAIFDALQESMLKLGVSVNKSSDSPIRFHIRFHEDKCTISIDTSGELLYKRGYRIEVAHAPIRESSAASLLMIAQWDKYNVIADPMCGSGVFIFESALMIKNCAPGLQRSFAFESWPSFNLQKWDSLKEKVRNSIVERTDVRLIASDIDAKAIQSAENNYKRLDVTIPIELKQRDCFEFNKNNEYGDRGLVISNLPYGKRVGATDELPVLYKKLGNHYRKYCKDWDFGFVCEDSRFPQMTQFKVSKKIKFVNGGIPVTFFYGQF